MFPWFDRTLSQLWSVRKKASLSQHFVILLQFLGLSQAFSERQRRHSLPRQQQSRVLPSSTILFFSRNDELPALLSTDARYGAPIPVCYTNSPDTLAQWLSDHIPTHGATIGFDVESAPNLPWRKSTGGFLGPATVQLATVNAVIVVQLVDEEGRPSDASASTLQSVLADKSIVKGGIGIDQDMLDLYRTWGCQGEIMSRFDMGGLGTTSSATTPTASVGSTTVSLKTLTNTVIHVELIKSRRLSMSDWACVPLKDDQIAYCARDAWAAAAVLSELAHRTPTIFSTDALIERLQQTELPVATLDWNAKARKVAKTRFNDIMGKGPNKVLRSSLTDALRKEVNELEEIMRRLAPSPIFRYDIEPPQKA